MVGGKTKVVFVGEGEDAEWCVSETTVVFVEEGQDGEWWVSGTMVVFVGKGMGRKLSGWLV